MLSLNRHRSALVDQIAQFLFTTYSSLQALTPGSFISTHDSSSSSNRTGKSSKLNVKTDFVRSFHGPFASLAVEGSFLLSKERDEA